MDLSKYSRDELVALKKDVGQELQGREKQEAKAAREELKQVAERYGFTLKELVESANAAGVRRGKAPAKFRDPNDTSKTWSGRGRKPTWVKEWEAAGHTLDELRIK